MVCGGIVTRTLHTLYSIGYEPADYVLLPHDEQSTPAPQQQEVRFDEFGAIMERDFEVMSGLSIVRGCLALAFYRALSIDLIERVFNLDFITRLEKEISVCYASVRRSHFLFSLLISLTKLISHDLSQHIRSDHWMSSCNLIVPYALHIQKREYHGFNRATSKRILNPVCATKLFIQSNSKLLILFHYSSRSEKLKISRWHFQNADIVCWRQIIDRN